jgi:hypothetical protein
MENYCVMCGEIIPEGRLICPNCEKTNENKIVKVDGYMAFNGVMIITPIGGMFPPFKEIGSWLYKPDCDCWYSSSGASYVAKICKIDKIF